MQNPAKFQYSPKSERYTDVKRDAVLIGSDEVFAIDVGLNPFLYGHDIPVKNIFSYAASFGSTRLEDIERMGCKEIIGSGLTKLINIGVRDITSQTIVRDITKREAIINCDPVILYGYKDEIEKAQALRSTKRFIIIYSIYSIILFCLRETSQYLS